MKMLDYINDLADEDWMTKVLVCPEDFGSLKFVVRRAALRCNSCQRPFPIRFGIPGFTDLNLFKREYVFEMKRYDNIALKPPETYDGLDESYPEERTEIFKGYLDDAPFYLNIGQGFGQLEKAMGAKPKMCLDQCIEFLKYCKSQDIPNTKYVLGFGERMPFKTDYYPAVVSDSVFQTLVDQREFLVENARVLAPEGQLLLAITYRWNYPRKPQDFPADDPELLLHFLRELGVHGDYQYFNLEKSEEDVGYKDGDYMLFIGEKK